MSAVRVADWRALWAPVPQIGPSVGNGTNVPYYNGNGAAIGSGELTYTFNIQTLLGNSMVAEIGYLGFLASHIQSWELCFGEIPYWSLPPNLNRFTTSGRTLLNSLVGSAAANTAGITLPFSGFQHALRTRGHRGPIAPALPAIFADRHHGRRRRPYRALHLSLAGDAVVQAVFGRA
jgi:hypothetical protein